MTWQGWSAESMTHSYLTQCIDQMVLSQLPHKIVNSLFRLEILNNDLAVLWWSGGDSLKPYD